MQQTTSELPPHRIVFYSHDSVGLGHARRNLELAHALAGGLPASTGRPVTGLLACSIDTPADDLPRGFDRVRLPGIRKERRHYLPRQLRLPLDSVVELRSAMLAAAVGELRPDLLIIDRHPFGIDGELLPALRRLRAQHLAGRVVLGLRDVLDEPVVTAAEWRRLQRLGNLSKFVDEVWAYGDPAVHDLRRGGQLPAELLSRTRYTGYLARGRRCVPSSARRPFVLTTVGGGADGYPLCLASAAADPPPGHRHVIVTGPQMPAPYRDAVRRAAGPHTTVVDSVPDAHDLIRRASAVITMAGYNSVCEVLNTPVPALLVPRERPRSEQRIRAETLAATDAVEMLAMAELTPARISDWLARRTAARVDRSGLARDGLDTVVGLATRLLAESANTWQGGRSVAV